LGTTGVSASVSVKTASEGLGLIWDVLVDPGNDRKLAAINSWATRGSRFLHFTARITPWGMVFTALQLAGEALYNYHNLDEQQRWMLGCCWGIKPQGWDQLQHAQKLAEATLLPTFTDKGIHRRNIDGEVVRTLYLVLPGLTAATFHDFSLRWSALLQKSPEEWDAGKALSAEIRTVSKHPLTLSLLIPDQWQGLSAVLQLRLKVMPTIKSNYLKADTGYLHYRIPLFLDSVSAKPITASAQSPTLTNTLEEIKITRELLHDCE